LDGDSARELLAIEPAVSVRRLVDLLHGIVTQHGQSPGELCQLFPVKYGLRFGAACHDRILADSLFVRHASKRQGAHHSKVGSVQDRGRKCGPCWYGAATAVLPTTQTGKADYRPITVGQVGFQPLKG